MGDSELEGDLIHKLLLRKHLAFGSGALDCNMLGVIGDPFVDLAKGTFTDGFLVAVCHLVQLTLREDVDAHTLEYVPTVFVKKPPLLSPLDFKECEDCHDSDNSYRCSQSSLITHRKVLLSAAIHTVSCR